MTEYEVTAQPGSGLTVLIVDDEPPLVRLLEFILQRQGYHTISAGNGDETLEAVRRYRPDLMILDVMMPRKDGYEVAAAIRADPDLGRTPIIMLTAKAQDEDIERGLSIGVDTYITKPFEPDKLAETIGAFLAGRTSAN